MCLFHPSYAFTQRFVSYIFKKKKKRWLWRGSFTLVQFLVSCCDNAVLIDWSGWGTKHTHFYLFKYWLWSPQAWLETVSLKLSKIFENNNACELTLLYIHLCFRGNWVGEAPYRTGKPCSVCPSSYGGSCWRNQCSPNTKPRRLTRY